MNVRTRQGGVALIEVMIAVVILAIGVLGAVGLQAKSLAALSDAGARVDAALAAEKVIGLMATDQANLASYIWDSHGGGGAPAVLAPWWLELAGDATLTPPVVGLLPTATAVIAKAQVAGSTATQVTVVITWQRRSGDPVNTHTIVATVAPTL
jgi:type IV pilus assembly protein PilV